jgi:preprotein translocase subunit SecY
MFKSILNTLSNCFKIPELKSRILFTMVVLAICRLACLVPVPGLDGGALSKFFESAAGKNMG